MALSVTMTASGVITIRLPKGDLKNAVQLLPSLEKYDEKSGEFLAPKVVDAQVFAEEVLHALLDEEEDGTTAVHRMFDAAFLEAIEQGAEGILLPDDDDYSKGTQP